MVQARRAKRRVILFVLPEGSAMNTADRTGKRMPSGSGSGGGEAPMIPNGAAKSKNCPPQGQ
jgi:hypothetical protein